jgi:YhcH/YjgK/YiaL family protein
MILDRLDRLRQYGNLPYGIPDAIDYLLRTDFTQVPEGRHELDGDRLIVIVQRFHPRPLAEATWEAHRRYVDVQYVFEGVEQMGHSFLHENLVVKQPYNADKDITFFEAQGTYFPVRAGEVAIFLPHDVHAPSLTLDHQPSEVRKAVVKCRIT